MVEIRRATAADAEKILEYCKIAGGETDNLTFGAEGVSITVEQERDYLENVLHSTNQLYLIAVQDGDVVGTGILSGFGKPRLAHRGELSLSVKQALWGNYIGSRFLEKIIRFARETAGMEILSLEVRSDNHRAIGLYKKFGFETIGTFKGFMKINGAYVDSDIMCLQLS